jgi:fibro-slime domain-containing protein
MASAAAAQTHPDRVVITAKVRDFKEMSPADSGDGHPHFNNRNGCSAQELGVNSVQTALDTTGPDDGGAFPGDNRTPVLVNSMPGTLAKCYDPPDRFPEWYSDRPGINRSFLVELPFVRDEGSGTYTFSDQAFFPIDAGKSFTPVNPDEGTYGNLQPDTGAVDLSQHDYGFTMEMHTHFIYHQGGNQMVAIRGDDDLWLFLNGVRAVDLGGVHQLQGDSVYLDSLQAALGLEDGMSYPFDFYFAERHVASSTCSIVTNLVLDEGAASAIAPRAAVKAAVPEGPISIYDRTGRLVRTVSGLKAGAKGRELIDAAGPALPAGVYFWRGTAPGGPGAIASGRIAIP